MMIKFTNFDVISTTVIAAAYIVLTSNVVNVILLWMDGAAMVSLGRRDDLNTRKRTARKSALGERMIEQF